MAYVIIDEDADRTPFKVAGNPTPIYFDLERVYSALTAVRDSQEMLARGSEDDGDFVRENPFRQMSDKELAEIAIQLFRRLPFKQLADAILLAKPVEQATTVPVRPLKTDKGLSEADHQLIEAHLAKHGAFKCLPAPNVPKKKFHGSGEDLLAELGFDLDGEGES